MQVPSDPPCTDEDDFRECRAARWRCRAANNSAHRGLEGTLPIRLVKTFILRLVQSRQKRPHQSRLQQNQHVFKTYHPAFSSSVSVQNRISSPSSNTSRNDRGMMPSALSNSGSRRDGVVVGSTWFIAFSSRTKVTLRKSMENTVFLVTGFRATRLPPITLNSLRRGTWAKANNQSQLDKHAKVTGNMLIGLTMESPPF